MMTLAERFEAKVDRSGSCHIWQASQLPAGYGRIGVGGRGGRILLAHRVAWELANGRPVPDGLYVMHSCDTPACVNFQHLSLGTPQQNSADMVAKKRWRDYDRAGEHNPFAKLTDKQVAEIRAAYTGRRGQQTTLARRYGVCKSSINRIVRDLSRVAP